MVVDNGHFSYGSNHWVVVSHHMLSLNTTWAGRYYHYHIYNKMAWSKGRGLVYFTTWMTLVSIQVDRGGRGHQLKEHILLMHSSFQTMNGTSLSSWTFSSLLFRWGTPLSTKVNTDADKIYLAFPLCLCILQAVKNCTVGRPGNKANLNYYQNKCKQVIFSQMFWGLLL